MKNSIILNCIMVVISTFVLSNCAGINVTGEIVAPERSQCPLKGYLNLKEVKTKHEVVCLLEATGYKGERALMDAAAPLACKCGGDGMVLGIKSLGLGTSIQSGRKTKILVVKYKEKAQKGDGMPLFKLQAIFDCRDSGRVWRDGKCK